MTTCADSMRTVLRFYYCEAYFLRGAKIFRKINLRALSFCEAPGKFRKFANFANLRISCALVSVSIQCCLHQSLRRVLRLLTSVWGVTLALPPPPRPPPWWSLKSPGCPHAHTCLSPGGACTPNGASTLGLPTGLLTGAGRDAMLAAMAASLAATACCTSGLRRMMSCRAGTSSSVRFRLVQPRSNSDACPLGDGVPLGGPRNYRIKKFKYCEVWNNFIYFRLDLLRGASTVI